MGISTGNGGILHEPGPVRHGSSCDVYIFFVRDGQKNIEPPQVIPGSVLPFSSAAGPGLSPAPAGTAVHISSADCGIDHRPRTSDAALHFDRLDGTVQGTCTALHAIGRAYERRTLLTPGKDPVGADLRAAGAIDAPLRVIPERVLPV
jgi:hypothetical protein